MDVLTLLERPLVSIPDDDITFSQAEAPKILEDFVCALCHADLEMIYLENHHRVLICCPDPSHGLVNTCGMLMRSSVSIKMEREYRRFQEVIHNVPEWNPFIDEGWHWKDAQKFIKTNACNTCNSQLVLVMNPSSEQGFDFVQIHCSKCRKSIRYTGYKPIYRR